MEKNISVILPVYNSVHTIKRCLDSLLANITEDIEIIAIDDGSTDGGCQLLNEYGDAYENVIVICLKHRGVSRSRNVGISHARGKYIVFVDADDYVEESYFHILKGTVEFDADYVFFDSWIRETGEKRIHSIGCNFLVNKIIFKEEIFSLIVGQRINAVTGKVFKKKIISEYDIQFPEDLSISEDLCFTLSYLEKCESVLAGHYIPYVYCFNRNGTYIVKPEYLYSLNRAFIKMEQFVKTYSYLECEELYQRFLQQIGDLVYKLNKQSEFKVGWSEELCASEVYKKTTKFKYTKKKYGLICLLLKHKKWKPLSLLFWIKEQVRWEN